MVECQLFNSTVNWLKDKIIKSNYSYNNLVMDAQQKKVSCDIKNIKGRIEEKKGKGVICDQSCYHKIHCYIYKMF